MKPYNCAFCGELAPDKFYTGKKSKCKSCTLLGVKKPQKQLKPEDINFDNLKAKNRTCKLCLKNKSKWLFLKDSFVCKKCNNGIMKEEEELLRIQKEDEQTQKVEEEDEEQYEEDEQMNRFDIIRIYESLDKEEQIRILAEIDESYNIFNSIEEVISQIKDARILAELWCELYLKYGHDYNLNNIKEED